MIQTQRSALCKLWRMINPCLAYYLLNLLVSLGFMAVFWLQVKSSMPPAQQPEALNQLVQSSNYVMTLVMTAAAIPLFSLWMYRDKRKSGVEEPAAGKTKIPFMRLLPAVLLGAAACILVNHLLEISGLTRQYAGDVDQVKQVLYQGNLIRELIGVGLLAPVAEELVFRGMAMRRMRENLGVLTSIGISSLIFGTMHGNFLQGLFAFVLGLLMGYVYERCKTLAAPILLHVGANLVSVIVSETDWLSFFYQNTAVFLSVTGAAAALTIGLFLYFYRWKEPSD